MGSFEGLGEGLTLREDPPLTLVGGSHSEALTREIGCLLGVEPVFPTTRFEDGEIGIKLPDSVRGNDVFIVQSHNRRALADGSKYSVNDAIIENLLIVDAARRGSAAEITAISPYYGYARQDRKDKGRTPISAAVIGRVFQERGASRLLTVDLHSGQTQGMVDIPFDHLLAENVFAAEVERRIAELPVASNGLILVSPDKGHSEVVSDFAGLFKGVGNATINKRRVDGIPRVVGIEGDDVAGFDCIVMDDMYSTGSTVLRAAEMLHSRGARSVSSHATHGIFAGNAAVNLAEANLAEIIATNTVDLGVDGMDGLNIRRLTVAPLIARAILEIHNRGSISSLFRHDNV